jgi:phosphatidylserine decarboxylase
VILAALGRLPQGALSRAFGAIADVPLPRPARRPVLGTFARAVGIDLSEAELPLEAYPTLNAFFVRRLRPGLRAWPEGGRVVASPVDGVLGRFGEIHSGRLLQAKGRWYSAEALLGAAEDAERFRGGTFVTIYLSPRHYHRIHSPCAGTIPRARHLPGSLLPVNAAAVSHVPDLFARNERLVCYLDTPTGSIALVAVGAYNVGRITAAFDPDWSGRRNGPTPGDPVPATNQRGGRAVEHRYRPPVQVAMGEEIMAFHLGSTIVLLLEPSAPPLRPDLAVGGPVRLGEALTHQPA